MPISKPPYSKLTRFCHLVLFMTFSMVAQADSWIHGWENHHESRHVIRLEPKFHYYYSTSNFDSKGKAFYPAVLSSAIRTGGSALVKYGINPELTAYGRANWTYNLLTEVGGKSRSVYGFQDQTLGLNYRVYEWTKGPSIDVQGQGDFALYNNRVSANQALPYLGDASHDYHFGAFATLPLDFSHQPRNRWSITAGSGYTYRTNRFSAAIPYLAQLQYTSYREGPGVSVFARGMVSLSTDPTLVTGGSVLSEKGGSGSYLINGVNPSLLMTGIDFSYQFNPSAAVNAGASYSMLGMSAPRGFYFQAGLKLAWGEGVGQIGHQSSRDGEGYRGSNKGMVNYGLSAKVISSNDRMNLVRIDRGTDDDINPGQIFDIFNVNSEGIATEAVARTKVTAVKKGEAVLEIKEYFKEVWINEGFVAKKLIE